MSNTIYITSLQEQTGSLIVSVGLMRLLKSKYDKVAFYRPIIASKESIDNDINFMRNYFSIPLDYEESYSYTLEEALRLISQNREDELIENIIKKHKELEKKFDFILIEGFYRSKFVSILDMDVNLEIAKNIGAKVVSIINGKNSQKEQIEDEINSVKHSTENYGCKSLAIFVNRVEKRLQEELQDRYVRDKSLFFLEEIDDLSKPTMLNIKEALSAEYIIGGDEELQNLIDRMIIGSMQTSHFLERINDKDLLIFAGDRDDLLLAAFSSFQSKGHPNASGILLTGGFKPSQNVIELLKSFKEVPLPVLFAKSDTFSSAKAIELIRPKITPLDDRKISLALGLFAKNVDTKSLLESFKNGAKDEIMTPMMFEYMMFEKARENKQKIVLPETEDDRILKASDHLLKLGIVDIVLLGDEDNIKYQASTLGLDLSQATVINPLISPLTQEFADKFYELRKHKGITQKDARELVENPTYFGTMMVQEGLADGMVSGAAHTTADTVRPALQIIKTKPGISIVSSVFFMCLDTKVLVYGDCAIVTDPDSKQLAEIAISSAETASSFGIEPRVAMLSYSTGSSGSGADVDKVREATELAKKVAPHIAIDGPMQYDAATVPEVAKSKMPDSNVAGYANVLIFPDLNTGNNTYKAVQRSSGAIAIGPILQGLNKPVNDLSRGCLIKDIINTVAITALQAQGMKGNDK